MMIAEFEQRKDRKKDLLSWLESYEYLKDYLNQTSLKNNGDWFLMLMYHMSVLGYATLAVKDDLCKSLGNNSSLQRRITNQAQIVLMTYLGFFD